MMRAPGKAAGGILWISIPLYNPADFGYNMPKGGIFYVCI